MKAQYEQKLMSSFLLWAENTLIEHGEAWTNSTQSFVYENTRDRPFGFLSYYSSDRQFLTEGTGVPDYVSVDGNTVYDNPTGATGMIIDYDKGRILIEDSVGQNAVISGDFPIKEINTYYTSQGMENIILNSEFNSSGQSYLEIKGDIGAERFTLPAFLILEGEGKNDPFAIGGMDDTKTQISAMVISQSMYDVSATCSLFKDSARRAFKVMPYSKYPIGRWGSLKSHPYLYSDLSDNFGEECVNVESVKTYNFSDSAKSKLPKDLNVGFIDFDLSCIRMPRSQFS